MKIKIRKRKKIKFFTTAPWRYHVGQIQQGLEILYKSDAPVFTTDGYDSGLTYLVVARPHVDKSKTFTGRIKQKYLDYKINRKASLKKKIRELQKKNKELEIYIKKSKIRESKNNEKTE